MTKRLGTHFEWGNAVYCNIELTDPEKPETKRITIQDSQKFKEKNIIEISSELKSTTDSSNKSVEIRLLIKSKQREWDFPSLTIRKHGKIFVYAKKFQSDNTRYLDVDITPNGKKLVNNVEIIGGSEFEEKRRIVQTDRRYFAYSLNLRGLLLYIYRISVSPPKKGQDKKLLEAVLLNPSLTKIAPFLKNAQVFEHLGFQVLESLTKISTEFRAWIPVAGRLDLLYCAMKTYFTLLNRHFEFSLDPLDRSFYSILTKYRLDMLLKMKAISEKYLQEIKDQYYSYYDPYDHKYLLNNLAPLEGYPKPNIF